MTHKVRSFEEAEVHVESLWLNVDQLANRVRYLEKLIDTKNSAWWKRLWWRIDGWPAWYQVGARKPRPWHGRAFLRRR